MNMLATSLLGYVYWLVISNIAGPAVLGETSAVIGLASLIGSAASLGVSVGAQRFLGGGVHGSKWDVGLYFGTLLALGLLMAGASFIICFFLAGVIGFNMVMAMVGAFIAFASVIEGVVSSLPVSALKTNVVMGVNITGNLAKFAVGVALILIGLGVMGTTFGYAVKQAVAIICLLAYASALLKKLGWELKFSWKASKDLVSAGFARWLPSIISSTGSWLGVLFLYGSSGAVETGFYFVASAIASVVWALPGSVLSLTFPVLSGMSSGRKEFSWRCIRLGLAVGSPLMVLLAIYPMVPLGLMGKAYVEASLILSILALTTVPQIIGSGVGSLVYAYGYYRLILASGLASNIPRILLYLLLTPIYGGLGVAYSFLAGTIIGFVATIIIANYIDFHMGWRDVAVAVSIPAIIGLLAQTFRLHWLLGSIIILTGSIFGYARLGLVEKRDLQELSKAILPQTVAQHVYSRFRWLFGLLYGD
jgi:O-antigen/teichoic acid export membrane protein